MLNIDLKKVLAEFGQSLGLDLAFDGGGTCVLALDEETPVILQASEEDSSLTLTSALRAELPSPLSLAQVEDLLALALDAAERRGGPSPVAGRDAESGLVVLYSVLAPSVLAQAPLAELFADFVTTRKAVAAMLDAPVEAPPPLGNRFSKMWA